MELPQGLSVGGLSSPRMAVFVVFRGAMSRSLWNRMRTFFGKQIREQLLCRLRGAYNPDTMHDSGAESVEPVSVLRIPACRFLEFWKGPHWRWPHEIPAGPRPAIAGPHPS